LARKKRLVSIPAEWRQGWQGSAFAPSENAVSAHGEQHLARRAYLRIAGFMARLRQSTEQLDALGRWYRILSEALRHSLHGRQLEPPIRLNPA
jgi:hypothetical protein